MIDLVSSILPIALLVGLGFVAVYTNALSSELVKALGQFVLHFALPALVLSALLRQDLRETLNWGYLIAYGGGSLLTFTAVFATMRFAMARSTGLSAVAALGGSASNSGFVGFPVASLTLGAPALTALPLCMVVENILIVPLALALAESADAGNGRPLAALRSTALRLARMPLILAIVAGVVLSALGVNLPLPVVTAVGMMADAAIPCALIVVGGTLASLEVRSVAADVLPVALGKLILHPLLVGLSFFLVGGIPTELMAAGIIFAAAPMITVYPILGARFGHERLAAAALLATTLAGAATMVAALAYALP
ncbi:MAG: AEC family transporter [Rhizobiaceae bacterium]|nr:AEC family transporter [Rhizobiaceae bacterium]